MKIMQFLCILLYLSICLSLCHCQNQTNAAINPADICNAIPYNFATKCNLTCLECATGSNEHSTCADCATYLQLSESHCIAPTNQTYYYQQFFQNPRTNDSQLAEFRYQQGVFTIQQIIQFCIASKYRFDLIGMFTPADVVVYEKEYALQISEIAINFRLLFLSENATVSIYINNVNSYNQTFASGVEFANPIQLDTTVTPNRKYGIFPADPQPYIDQFLYPIKTGLIATTGFKFKIEILVQGISQNTSLDANLWAFNEFTITAIKCDVCVTQSLRDLQKNLGIVIGASGGSTIILFAVMFFYLKYQNKRRNSKSRNKTHQMLLDTDRQQKGHKKKEKKQKEKPPAPTANSGGQSGKPSIPSAHSVPSSKGLKSEPNGPKMQ